jgi:2-polyprenyl-3-methyl-5-hydroxy-6-metoxy-1,4-benzoquinol methylase
LLTDIYAKDRCADRWTRALAPRTGDLRAELTLELADYFRRPVDQIETQLAGATERFTDEWCRRVADPRDEKAVTRFYNESDTELFDLARWHAEDPIHYRTLICCDVASRRPGRAYLDYGSGIGSDALLFAAAGFDVTLADVSEPLLAFARWRCETRGITVKTIDLKRERPRASRFDAVVCFDVLEHIHRPLRTLRSIHRAMRPGGLLFVHAPFGRDPERPMHVVHEDVVTPRMRATGFHWRDDLESAFPQWMWAPHVYESLPMSVVDRVGYTVHDRWLNGPFGKRLARMYRQLVPSRRSAAA